MSHKIETSPFSRRVNTPQRDNLFFYSVADWWGKSPFRILQTFQYSDSSNSSRSHKYHFRGTSNFAKRDKSQNIDISFFALSQYSAKRQPLFLQCCRLVRQIAILDTGKFPIICFPQILKEVTSIIWVAPLILPKEITRNIETSPFSRRVNIPQRNNLYFYSVADWWGKSPFWILQSFQYSDFFKYFKDSQVSFERHLQFRQKRYVAK